MYIHDPSPHFNEPFAATAHRISHIPRPNNDEASRREHKFRIERMAYTMASFPRQHVVYGEPKWLSVMIVWSTPIYLALTKADDESATTTALSSANNTTLTLSIKYFISRHKSFPRDKEGQIKHIPPSQPPRSLYSMERCKSKYKAINLRKLLKL